MMVCHDRNVKELKVNKWCTELMCALMVLYYARLAQRKEETVPVRHCVSIALSTLAMPSTPKSRRGKEQMLLNTGKASASS